MVSWERFFVPVREVFFEGVGERVKRVLKEKERKKEDTEREGVRKERRRVGIKLATAKNKSRS